MHAGGKGKRVDMPPQGPRVLQGPESGKVRKEGTAEPPQHWPLVGGYGGCAVTGCRPCLLRGHGTSAIGPQQEQFHMNSCFREPTGTSVPGVS